MEKINIIDADSLVYIVSWNNKESDDLMDYINYLREWIYIMTEKTGCTKYVGFLTDGKKNFRYALAKKKKYKGHRKAEKPKFFREIKEHLIKKLGFIQVAELEADDLCLMYATYCEQRNIPWIVSSQDKDLMQMPGTFYNYRRDEFHVISKIRADYNFYKQMLSGDTSDNIGGLEGIGQGTADKILQVGQLAGKSLSEIVVNAYLETPGRLADLAWNKARKELSDREFLEDYFKGEDPNFIELIHRKMLQAKTVTKKRKYLKESSIIRAKFAQQYKELYTEHYKLLYIIQDPGDYFTGEEPQEAEHIEVINEILNENGIPTNIPRIPQIPAQIPGGLPPQTDEPAPF